MKDLEDKTVRKKYLPMARFTVIASMLLVILIAAPAPAIQGKWKESRLQGGWQIWIPCGNADRIVDRVQFLRRGAQLARLRWYLPGLGADIDGEVLIAHRRSGFAEYDFESPVAGKAFGWARVADMRGGNQSWVLVLNGQAQGFGIIVDTQGKWIWKSGREGNQFLRDLKKGKNTLRLFPREAGLQAETLCDILVISSRDLGQPRDGDYQAAKDPLAVEPAGKLATTWATLKTRF